MTPTTPIGTKKVFMLMMSCLVAIDQDVSPGEFEEELESALAMMPSHAAHTILELDVSQASDRAFCCEICDAPITQRVELSGTYRAPVDMASGVPQGGDFDGKQNITYICSADESHELGELGTLLSKVAEINLRE